MHDNDTTDERQMRNPVIFREGGPHGINYENYHLKRADCVAQIKRAMQDKGEYRRKLEMTIGEIKKIIGADKYQFHESFTDDSVVIFEYLDKPLGLTWVADPKDGTGGMKFCTFYMVDLIMLTDVIGSPKFWQARQLAA